MFLERFLSLSCQVLGDNQRPCRRSTAYWLRRPEDNLGYFFYDRGCKVEDVRLMVDPSTRPVLRSPQSASGLILVRTFGSNLPQATGERGKCRGFGFVDFVDQALGRNFRGVGRLKTCGQTFEIREILWFTLNWTSWLRLIYVDMVWWGVPVSIKANLNSFVWAATIRFRSGGCQLCHAAAIADQPSMVFL